MRYEESRVIKHTPKNLFNLVSDVSKYPEFLPWCLGARVKNIKQNNFDADLIIGFKIYKEIYSSRIFLDNVQNIIKVEYKDGPFERLENHWIFKKTMKGAKWNLWLTLNLNQYFYKQLWKHYFLRLLREW